MFYAQMRKYDVANGEGIHSTLFVSGCLNNCAGCFNLKYRNFDYGDEFTEEAESRFLEYCNDSQVNAISILGGEPLQQNHEEMIKLMKKLKEVNKPIWLWTGHTFEELNHKQLEIVSFVDILIDGRFVEELKDLRLKWRGSSNQRVIDIQKSLKEGRVVLYDTENL